MPEGKLITVSFRLPYRFSVQRSTLVTTPSAGGLATALTSYFDATRTKPDRFDSFHWVGVSDLSKHSFEKVSKTETVERDGMVMHPLFLPSKLKEGFYNGFCNSVIWPLFLYFPSFVSYEQEYFGQYIEANQLMLEKILEIYKPGDTIWIHDYHWMLLPSLLRACLPHAPIGFFLHIPFPSFELYRLLPRSWRVRLLQGLVGADVIGLQTHDFVEHFVETTMAVLPEIEIHSHGLKDGTREITVKSFPISIDYEKFASTSKSPFCLKATKKVKAGMGDSKIILSVDRLDYTKAIFSRLESFALFLEQNEPFRERVSYFLLLVPTRESIQKYKENKFNVEALISRINGKYGTWSWTPIVYHYRSIDFKNLVALYAAADIALIVSSRDGMNLVAKEYVACRRNQDGVLILSETAGASTELSDAIQVNANDRQEIANAILEALQMPSTEQRKRMARMQKHIMDHDVEFWAKSLFQSINQTANQTLVGP